MNFSTRFRHVVLFIILAFGFMIEAEPQLDTHDDRVVQSTPRTSVSQSLGDIVTAVVLVLVFLCCCCSCLCYGFRKRKEWTIFKVDELEKLSSVGFSCGSFVFCWCTEKKSILYEFCFLKPDEKLRCGAGDKWTLYEFTFWLIISIITLCLLISSIDKADKLRSAMYSLDFSSSPCGWQNSAGINQKVSDLVRL